MNPGTLRHLAVIEQQVTTLDGVGQRVSTWTEFTRVRCAIARTPGSELFASAARQGRTPTVFQMRYQDGLRRDMRIVFDERRFNIVDIVDSKGLRAMLDVAAVEEGPSP